MTYNYYFLLASETVGVVDCPLNWCCCWFTSLWRSKYIETLMFRTWWFCMSLRSAITPIPTDIAKEPQAPNFRQHHIQNMRQICVNCYYCNSFYLPELFPFQYRIQMCQYGLGLHVWYFALQQFHMTEIVQSYHHTIQ